MRLDLYGIFVRLNGIGENEISQGHVSRFIESFFAGFIALNNEGKEIFTFGKHKGALVDDVFDKEPGYFGWIQNADFPLYTKKVLTAIKLRKLNTKS